MDDFRGELRRVHPCDLPAIRRYIAWVQFRRAMHEAFYHPVHWVQPGARRVHWVGRG